MLARLALIAYAIFSLLLLTGVAAPRARAADETINCASCGKKIKKSSAIKVVKNGRVYYVCSEECAKKIKK